MSTKIYYAIRVHKDRDIKNIISKMKQLAEDYMCQSTAAAKFLKNLHKHAITIALNEPDNINAKYALSEYNNDEFGVDQLYMILDILKKESIKSTKSIWDITLTACATYDEDYWYIKFFPNSAITRSIYEMIYEQSGIEDFHYQDQVDYADEDKHEMRRKKWDELLPDGNWDAFPFEIIIMDPNKLKKIIRKNWWSGKKELYEHMLYKFNEKFKIDEITRDSSS